MSNQFRKKIKQALQDEHLQTALDGNAERRMNVRKQSFANMPDYEERRKRIHAVRAEVIQKLDDYLDKFTTQAQKNGLIVHRAADARQAVQTVLDIAQQHQASLIAKSKSMVSEEIKLNDQLEAAGLKVVETDLGEYIVQLRGEPPAHIITPAVHLRREDVARLFHEKLGMPLTDDIKVMTDLARRNLRDVFLKARIGISGVNMAVAETGTFCILTNEGNGRMVTTLPPVHIALMGMERIVPRLSDLAMILDFLPRSATGQKITVYANLLHGPRKPGDADGPAERHLIIIDNGRSRLRQSALAEALYCIRCGACLNACPVFREIGGHSYVSSQGKISAYPGPIGSVIAPFYFGLQEFGHLARASTLCGACREVCPADIDLPKLLLRIRAGRMETVSHSSQSTDFLNPPQSPFEKGEEEKEAASSQYQKVAPFQYSPLEKTSPTYPLFIKGGRGDFSFRSNVPGYLKAGLKFYSWIAARADRFRWIQKMFFLLSLLSAPFSNWMRLPSFTRWGQSKDFPRLSKRPFRKRFQSQPFAGINTGTFNYPSNMEIPPAAATPLTQPTSLLDRFTQELTDLEGKIVLCHAEELTARIIALLQTRDIHELAAWDKQYLPAGLIEFLQANGLRVLDRPNPATRAGLTGVLAAAAETGTLAIPGGPGRPLSVSLLPEIHMAVLREADIFEKLEPILNLEAIKETSAVALVSGPSRTADIEMTLTIGVHGPAEVHVFCIRR
jgi:L-lactate dehydrogenase complex protein LldF